MGRHRHPHCATTAVYRRSLACTAEQPPPPSLSCIKAGCAPAAKRASSAAHALAFVRRLMLWWRRCCRGLSSLSFLISMPWAHARSALTSGISSHLGCSRERPTHMPWPRRQVEQHTAAQLAAAVLISPPWSSEFNGTT
jgi:hypothetical protein